LRVRLNGPEGQDDGGRRIYLPGAEAENGYHVAGQSVERFWTPVPAPDLIRFPGALPCPFSEKRYPFFPPEGLRAID